MTLQQFASDDDPNIVHADEAMRSRLLRPGDRVTNERDGGEGIVVAIVGDRIHVLWAVEPSFRFQLPKIQDTAELSRDRTGAGASRADANAHQIGLLPGLHLRVWFVGRRVQAH